MKNQQSREKSAESVSPRYKLRGLNRDAFFDEQISVTPKGLTHALKCGAKSFECIEDHLDQDLDEFACAVNHNSKTALLADLITDANRFKLITAGGVAETIVGGYLLQTPPTYNLIFITVTALAMGAAIYSACQVYTLSKEISELEKELQKSN